MSAARRRERGGLWRTEIVRAVLSGHSILGIAFAAILYLVCLTGTISVFLRDFQRWEQPRVPTMTAVSDAAVARAVDAVAARQPGKSIFVALPTDDVPRLMLSTGGDADDETWFADAAGSLAAREKAPWIDFVQELHTELHLPKTLGRFLVGLAGVALVSSLVSGVLAHPRIFRDAFHLRLGGSRRLEQADWHNRLGVWPLPFHLLVSLTGALLGLSTLIVGVLALLLFRGDSERVYALLLPPKGAVDARPAPVPDLAAMLAATRARSAGATPEQINVDNWGRRDARVTISSSRPRLIAQQDSLTFTASGAVASEEHPAGQSVGKRILGSLGQLHFGWFGGWTIRLAYGLLGLALCMVTVSGIEVWLARRRDKGRGSDTWERVWTAIVWGQPFVLALLAAAASFEALDGGAATRLWALLSAPLLLAASIRAWPRRTISRWLQFGTAAAMFVAVCGNSFSNGAAGLDPAAWAVDAVLVLIALGIVGRSYRNSSIRALPQAAS